MNPMMASMLQPGERVLHRAEGSLIASDPLAGLRIWVTNRRILVSSGWLQRRVETRMLRDIASIELSQTLFDRLSGVGTIRILSGRPNVRPMELKDVSRALQLHAVLLGLQAGH